ncbi:YjbH domain-containing protein [Catenovulum sp. 2E275]|uniref:YjbH domain-containing protein n=1 Tax=Catenovulum sp. 2E275 TaxID=2980497 RepID=UPI0021D347B7|nr:YjbH domain-containing protein [Catenovulum sp. 2E275]MCU4676320.1 YjbH domain-containing protein [Catenovulum sp. 2E275]
MRLLSTGISLLLASGFVQASEQPVVQPSLNGYGGYFNVPTAFTLQEGYGSVIKSNLTEKGGQYRDTPNFQFGVSLWQSVELSTRISAYEDDTDGSSDLSANIKVQIPFIPDDWFKLAVGVQDLGGAANHYDARFIVASKYFADYNLDISAGMGKSDSALDRIDGTFAAIKWQPYEWGALVAEYDASSTNYGVELATPKAWLGGTQVISKVMLGASDEGLGDERFYSVGLNFPLQRQADDIEPAQLNIVTTPAQKVQNSDIAQNLNLLNKALVRRDFEDFKIGLATPSHIVIEVENSVYTTNLIDTYGVVLGLISQYSPEQVTDFTVRITQTGMVVDSISGNLAQYRAFLKGDSLKLKTQAYAADVNWYENEDSFLLKPRLTLYPHINSTVGTEVGMLDYSVALATHAEIPLWKGAAFTALHINQLFESEDYRDGRAFASGRQPDSALLNATFHQAFNLPYNSRVLFNYGQFDQDFIQTSIEADWISNNGAHRVSVYAGDYKFDGEEVWGWDRNCVNDPNTMLIQCYRKMPQGSDRKVQVAKYRYYSSDLDSSFLIKYGKYWSGDKGWHLIASRHFDDVEVNFSFKATKGALSGLSAFNYEDDYQKQVGIGFTVPLGPRKDFNSRYINIRGRADWSYVLHTLVGEEHNGLTFGLADEARNFYNLSNHFNNFDRSGLSYIYQNQDRLRSAYFELR